MATASQPMPSVTWAVVDSSAGGSFEGPGEHEEGEGVRRDELGGDEHAPGGWVPPEQRAWRHPSELGQRSADPFGGFGPVLRTRPPGRRTAWATSLVGVGAVAALVSGGLILASHSRTGPTAAQPVRTTTASAVQSIVRLDVASSNASSYGCGVVVAAGGLIATNATLLANAKWIVATTSSGRRETATVVGVDLTSDVGLLSVRTSLPVARFVDWSQVQTGTGAVLMAFSSVPSGTMSPDWSAETIASAGDPVQSGPGSGMASVVATAPASDDPDGAVLMEPDGAVIGILDKSGVASAGGGSVFLPGAFVVQVAAEMINDGGNIQHGWLGIKGAEPKSKRPAGALVTEVDKAGAADNHLRRGDVIEAINGRPVRSMADLRSRLYLLAPGTWVDLEVDRGNTARTVGLWLSSAA